MEGDLLDDIVSLIDQGIVIDRSKTPIRPVATVVASKTEKGRFEDLARFIDELVKKYPRAQLVVGDTSPLEKAAAIAAGMYGIPCEVIVKAKKGEWDEGSTVRDERVVAKASHIVAFDSSARSVSYRRLAERQGKYFSTI